MRVAIPCMFGEYDDMIGGGQHRYKVELWRRIKEYPVSLEKKEFSNHNFLGNNVSFFLGSMFSDFSKFDIIHHLDNRVFFPLKKGKGRILTTVHDLAVLTRPDLHKELRKGFLTKKYALFEFMRYSNIRALHSDFIIANSSQTENEVLSFGYPKDKIFKVPLGIDERFSRRVKKRNHRLFTIGYIGAFSEKKNITSAIKAIYQVRSDKFIAELWGRSGASNDMVHSLGRKDTRLRLMGSFPDISMTDTYDRFDVFVFPSLHEGFGLPILEAYARKVPVVIFAQAQIPKEVSKYAVKVKNEDEMAETIEQIAAKGMNEVLLETARNYALTFSWSRTAELTYKAYEKIMHL